LADGSARERDREREREREKAERRKQRGERREGRGRWGTNRGRLREEVLWEVARECIVSCVASKSGAALEETALQACQ
jgi:hypothetical protein